jgi:hypothetical protein
MTRLFGIIVPLAALIVTACIAEPADKPSGSRSTNRSLPALDQGIPPELSAATFAMG